MELHTANQDVKFVNDAYGVGNYIVSYVSKAEQGISKLLKRIDEETSKQGLNEMEKLRKFGNVLDQHREVSQQELIYRLNGFPMCQSSRKVKFINVGKKAERDGLLKSNLDDLEEDESVFMNSIHDYYQNRPDEDDEEIKHEINKDDENIKHIFKKVIRWDSITLADFVADFEIVYGRGSKKVKENDDEKDPLNDDDEPDKDKQPRLHKLKNNMGYIRERTKKAIIRYYLDNRNQENYNHGLRMLFVPFQNEDNEIVNQDPISELDAVMADPDKKAKFDIQLKTYQPYRELVDDLINKVKEISGEEDASDIEIEDDENEFDDEQEELMQEETTHPDDINEWLADLNATKKDVHMDILALDELKKKVNTLNSQQCQVFDDFLNQVVADKEQFFTYISGEAGTGKSYLLTTLIEGAKHMYRKSGDKVDEPRVLVMAPSANAAYIVGRKTIHSALAIDATSNMYQSKPKSAAQQVNLTEQYHNLEMIFIDEVSMVGTNMLQSVHQSLCEIKGDKSKPFGGVSVIVSGDLHQLRPVGDNWIFKGATLNGRPANCAPNHWKSLFKNFHLTEKVRSKGDKEFQKYCQNISSGILDEQTVKYF